MALLSTIQSSDIRSAQEAEIHGTERDLSVYECRDWVENIYCLATSDWSEGGQDGIDNRQAKQLGSRTQYLKTFVESLRNDLDQLFGESGRLASIKVDGISLGPTLSTARFAYCNTSGSTAEKSAMVQGFSLDSGSAVTLLFINTNTALPSAEAPITLNVNNTGAFPIQYRGVNLPVPGMIRAGAVLSFVYNGQKKTWDVVGELENPTDMRVQLTGAVTTDPAPLSHGTTALLSVKSLDISRATEGILPMERGGTGNASGKASALMQAQGINGILFDGSSSITSYFTCATKGSEEIKAVSKHGAQSGDSSFVLQSGAVITVYFSYTNTADAGKLALNVHGTGAKFVRYRGNTLPSSVNLVSKGIYDFVFDGTYWVLMGEYGSAPKNHSSSSAAYGVGGQAVFGHVKLSDTPDASKNEARGVAATPKMVFDALEKSRKYSDTFLSLHGGCVDGGISLTGSLTVNTSGTAEEHGGVSEALLTVNVLAKDRYTGADAISGIQDYRLTPLRVISSKNSINTSPGLSVGGGGALMLVSGESYRYVEKALVDGSIGSMALVSDKGISFTVNAGDLDSGMDKVPSIRIDTDLGVHPNVTNTGSLGTEDKRWDGLFTRSADITGNIAAGGSITAGNILIARRGASISGSTTLSGNLTLTSVGSTIYATTRSSKNAATGTSAVGLGIVIPKESLNSSATGPVTRYPFHVIGTKEGSTDYQPGFAISGNSGALVLSGGDAMGYVLDDLSISGPSENVVVASDNSIYFGTNYQSAQNGNTNQRVAVMDSALNFYPLVNTGGKIGTPTSRWEAFYGRSADIEGNIVSGGTLVTGSTHYIHSKGFARGVKPASNLTENITVLQDRNNLWSGGINYNQYTDGRTYTQLFCFDNRTGDASVGIGCGYTNDGNWYTYAPTPATADVSDKIATTKFVKNYVSANSVPAGMLVPFCGGHAIPAGWLLCNGAAVSRVTFAALFQAIGTMYGAGDGKNTFNLPDMRGRFVEGTDGDPQYVNPGLPNIWGHFLADNSQIGTSRETSNGAHYPPTGAYYNEGINPGYDMSSGGGYKYNGGLLGFSASRCSSVYGASNTVQPKALRIRYLIKY